MLDKDYSRNIRLRCVVCGDTDSFKTDDNEQTIICERCGREYPGGKDEPNRTKSAIDRRGS